MVWNDAVRITSANNSAGHMLWWYQVKFFQPDFVRRARRQQKKLPAVRNVRPQMRGGPMRGIKGGE